MADPNRLHLQRIADTEGNERLANETAVGATNPVPDAFAIRCECGNPVCHEPIRLSRELYDEIRGDPMQFIVHRGHEFPEAEDVVAVHDRFEVVRKHEIMREVVERSDPRSQPRRFSS